MRLTVGMADDRWGDLDPEFILVGRIVQIACKDALQTRNEKLRQEAWEFLEMCAPSIAHRLRTMISDYHLSREEIEMSDNTKEASGKTLNSAYGDTIKKIRQEQDARTGADTVRDTRITRKKTPAEMAEKARIEELERQAAKEVADREKATAELEKLHGDKLYAWMQAGGAEDEFRQVWPEIRQRHLMSKIGLGE